MKPLLPPPALLVLFCFVFVFCLWCRFCLFVLGLVCFVGVRFVAFCLLQFNLWLRSKAHSPKLTGALTYINSTPSPSPLNSLFGQFFGGGFCCSFLVLIFYKITNSIYLPLGRLWVTFDDVCSCVFASKHLECSVLSICVL